MSMDNRRGPTPPNNPYPPQNRPPGGVRFNLLWVVLLIAFVVGEFFVVPEIQNMSVNRTDIPYSELRRWCGRAWSRTSPRRASR
jgi:hypothetical protein